MKGIALVAVLLFNFALGEPPALNRKHRVVKILRRRNFVPEHYLPPNTQGHNHGLASLEHRNDGRITPLDQNQHPIPKQDYFPIDHIQSNDRHTNVPQQKYGTPNINKNPYSIGHTKSLSTQYGAPEKRINIESEEHNYKMNQQQQNTPDKYTRLIYNPIRKSNANINNSPIQLYGTPSKNTNKLFNHHRNFQNNLKKHSPIPDYTVPIGDNNPRPPLNQNFRNFKRPAPHHHENRAKLELTPPSDLNVPGKHINVVPLAQVGVPRGTPTFNDYEAPKFDVHSKPQSNYGAPQKFESRPANYRFKYDVNDGQGSDFGHAESRTGSLTQGRYYVLLPDGKRQVVDYEADEHGYRPRITYENVGADGYDYKPMRRMKGYHFHGQMRGHGNSVAEAHHAENQQAVY